MARNWNMAYSIIDVDTHITEPADTWTSRVAARHRDHVPRVEVIDGRQIWLLGDDRIGAVGPTAPAGWSKPMPDSPAGYDEVHPAAYDADARLKLMDERGVWAEVLYPNVGGFGAQRFLSINDADLKYSCVRAYNDFLSEWCSADDRRLIPSMATPFWDVDDAVAEVERCAALGYRSVNFTGEPQVFGLPYLGEAHWDPFWSAVCDCDMVVSFHIGSGEFNWDHTRVERRGFAEAYALQSVDLFTKNGIQVCDLLLSGVLPRFPKLRVVSVESGIGWLPFMLEALDNQFVEGGGMNDRPEFDKLPSEYFTGQVYTTFWFEESAPQDMLGGRIPLDNVLFETDFPHPTCLYDNVEEKIAASLGHFSPEDRHQLLWGNAEKLYRVEVPA